MFRTMKNTARAVANRRLRRPWLNFGHVGLLLLAGCGGQDHTTKTSLFEDHHAIAAHWPTDLMDVSVKLRERMSLPEVNPEALAEIKDLVSWTAEVAADTNLTEADWLPIYRASESLTANLRNAKETITPDHRAQLKSFCELIDETSQRIPEQLPRLVRGES